jgi:hypothetical protein
MAYGQGHKGWFRKKATRFIIKRMMLPLVLFELLLGSYLAIFGMKTEIPDTASLAYRGLT